MRRENGSLLGLYTIGIAMLFLAGFFMLVVFGAQSYRNTVAVQNDNMESRAMLSYLSTTIKGYDSSDAVLLRDTPYGQMLVIADGDSGYGLKIYCYEGNLIEEYTSLAAELSPERAQTIGQTDLFRVEIDDDLVRVETDAGRVMVRLRSEGGGA